MKGFVPTPPEVVDLMVDKLLVDRGDPSADRILDPGCGDGPFIAGVIRWFRARGLKLPRIVGIEMDPGRALASRNRFGGVPEVEIRQADFLEMEAEPFDLVIGNPPYVSILSLDADERARYRRKFQSARGRFDLDVLFFEQGLRMLADAGRLVFITPEKYLYVETARSLRHQLVERSIDELHFLDEDTFEGLVTYPLITTLSVAEGGETAVVHRDGRVARTRLNTSESWLPLLNGYEASRGAVRLGDVAVRISCGVATGADQVFVVRSSSLPTNLHKYAHPTISGRQISPGELRSMGDVMLAPYDNRGHLMREDGLGELGAFLRAPERRKQLEARTCADRKPWFAFHDSFPIELMRRPKLLCKDITSEPFFVVDHEGTLVPRHSVYYVVPACTEDLIPLAEYLNSRPAADWMRAHCQRAAGGFLRLQSHVLKKMPLPEYFQARAGACSRAGSLLEVLPV